MALAPVNKFSSQPERWPTLAEVDNRSGHIRVSAEVAEDRVRLRQSEHLSRTVGVAQIFSVDHRTHTNDYTCR